MRLLIIVFAFLSLGASTIAKISTLGHCSSFEQLLSTFEEDGFNRARYVLGHLEALAGDQILLSATERTLARSAALASGQPMHMRYAVRGKPEIRKFLHEWDDRLSEEIRKVYTEHMAQVRGEVSYQEKIRIAVGAISLCSAVTCAVAVINGAIPDIGAAFGSGTLLAGLKWWNGFAKKNYQKHLASEKQLEKVTVEQIAMQSIPRKLDAIAAGSEMAGKTIDAVEAVLMYGLGDKPFFRVEYKLGWNEDIGDWELIFLVSDKIPVRVDD